MCLALAACETLQKIPLFRPQPTPTPTAQPTPTPSPQPTSSETSADQHKHHRLAKAKKKPAPMATATVEKEADKTPVLSLAPGPDPLAKQPRSSRLRAPLTTPPGRLATVDRSKLAAQRATDYDLVTGFIRGAQEALGENDFVRAESLGEKAAVLARLLAANGAAPR